MAQAARPAASVASSCSTAEHFRLAGPSLPLDPRLHAFRRDLADIRLAGQVIAPHYASPVVRAGGAQHIPIRTDASQDAAILSELLPGESFAVLEYAGGWAWGYCVTNPLVGYVEAIELTDPIAPTHIVCEKCAPVAADDRVTSPVLASLPMGSLIRGHGGSACLATEYGCVSASHLRPIADKDEDPAAVAERLIHAPWQEGGRTWQGVDAAGLIQLALLLCGMDAPRLLDQQRGLGTLLPDGARLSRNDLVFWDGGAGIMIDDLMMIHASARAGKVTVEAAAVASTGPAEYRRLPD